MLGGSSAAAKLLIEMAYAQDTIKSQQAEEFYQKRWDDIVTLNAIKTTEQRLLSAGLTYGASAVQHLAYVAAVVMGVFLVFTGDFTVGTIIAVSILTSRTLAPVTQLSSIVVRWKQVGASLTVLDTLIDSAQDRPQDREFLTCPILEGRIAVDSLQFNYDEQSPVLNISGLRVAAGERIALLGPNGSGKTSFLKVIAGMFDFSNGSLSIDGYDIRQIDPYDLRRNVYYLPQEVKLFAGTLRDNLAFGSNRWSEAQTVAALDFAGLSNLVANNPKGLDLEIGDGGVGLSLGQRQCVGLARMYLQNPSIVLMDEPTASLDQMQEGQIIVRLQEWLKGRTCIITTHRMQLLDLVDRIVVLQNGELTLDDTVEVAMQKLGSNQSSGPQHEAA